MKSDAYIFARLRKKEFGRLDRLGHVYLDYTGGNLYPASLVHMQHRFLKKAVYGNPHSVNPASALSEKHVQEARNKVLEFFNAADYYCIFTANASAALKIVGECYPFSADSHLLLTADNHNSVNGIRDYCSARGSGFTYVPMDDRELTIPEEVLDRHLTAHAGQANKLFAYPAQSNVSGAKHSLAWIEKAQLQGWDVLLDAAAFVPTSILDLSAVSPDFVSVSFYKIFGYPTGIGCLLVRKPIFHKLKKPWYAGGTITISAVRYSTYFLKPDHERFEDGTVNYLDIPAITRGLQFMESIGMQRIARHIQQLSQLFLENISSLRHDNQQPLIRLYGPQTTERRGGTFLINFLDTQGQLYPFSYIEERANAWKISLRTGCFCNPGIDETNHGLSGAQLEGYFTSRRHGDYLDMISYLGALRGAVRVSIGIATVAADIHTFMAFSRTFLNKLVPQNLTTSFMRAEGQPSF